MIQRFGNCAHRQRGRTPRRAISVISLSNTPEAYVPESLWKELIKVGGFVQGNSY